MADDEVRSDDYGLKQFRKYSKLSVALRMIARFAIREYSKLSGFLCRSKIIRDYLRFHTTRKLQLGAGPNILTGWLNTDYYPGSRRIVFLNATKRFPFEERTFDYIFSEHHIEHLTYREGLSMLRECYRILKTGGKIRIATPDLETLIGLHTPDKSELQQKYIKWIIDRYLPEEDVYRESFVINNAFRNFGHQFIYDYETLKSSMEVVGFIEINRYAPGESEDQILRGIDSHGKSTGDEDINRFETMVLEAKRPT